MTGRSTVVSDDIAATGQGEPRPGSPRWSRILVATGAVIALLLLGASVGMLVRPGVGGVGGREAGPVDVGFAQDMSTHHRQAVLMAGLARDQSDDQVIRGIAFDIETNQLEQIGWMQGWLSLWNAAPVPPGRYMTWMDDPAGMPAMAGHTGGGHDGAGQGASPGIEAMPGMATPEEITELRAARGRAFDVLFLQLMIRHHQGGVPMATYAAQHAETAQVRNMADKIVVAQSAEVTTLTGLLADRGARPLPPPR